MQFKHSEKRTLRIAAVALLSGLAQLAIVVSKEKRPGLSKPPPQFQAMMGYLKKEEYPVPVIPQ